METTPMPLSVKTEPSDLESAALINSDKRKRDEQEDDQLTPTNTDTKKQHFHSDSNSVTNPDIKAEEMNTDAPPTCEQIQPSESESTALINSKQPKNEQEEEEEKPTLPNTDNNSNKDDSNWKTSLCSYYRRQSQSENLKCKHGDKCRFAHGEAELRPKPDNSWDPTSDKGKSVNNKRRAEREQQEEEKVTIDESSLDKCVIGLSRNWNNDSLKRFLDEKGISCTTFKKKKGMSVGFVTFENTDKLTTAIEILRESSDGGKKIKIADAMKRSFEKKQKTEEGENDENMEGEGFNSLKIKSVREAVTPLSHMPYSQQLDHKKATLSQLLKKLTRNARKACPDDLALPDWIIKSREIGGLPCKLEGILESPLTDGYRNKCEFSVGFSLDGKITVGFMLGNFREGVTAVEQPTDCPNVSKISSKYASIFQDFLRGSELPVWNRIDNTGFWRQLTVREGRKPEADINVAEPEALIKEVMLIIQVCSSGVQEEAMKSEFEKLKNALSEGESSSSPPLPLTTIVIQDHVGISNAAPADCPLIPLLVPETDGPDCSDNNNLSLLVDKTRIHDYISNLRFSISPTAFFQVNTLAAERLYSLAGDWADLNKDTLLFDVCCGTGTIGLTLAHRVGMVVGIEMNESAVSDAEKNAVLNGIDNCKFVCGKAEDVMSSILTEYLGSPTAFDNNNKSNSSSVESETEVKCEEEEKTRESEEKDKEQCRFKNVVAIVDPPRVGLHPVVIKALRTHPRIRRLVYISCNPDSLVANAIELCTPSSEKAEKNKGHKGWRKMGNAGLARHRTKSMPNSEHFSPVRCMAVDLFPHTSHCEMVMLFNR
ncbi:hypothetical protein LUZ60_016074 [Juncus effusus]|nr:hypothetical protein LUZ60_016074 [Juncus effusus]